MLFLVLLFTALIVYMCFNCFCWFLDCLWSMSLVFFLDFIVLFAGFIVYVVVLFACSKQNVFWM